LSLQDTRQAAIIAAVLVRMADGYHGPLARKIP
jgi:hypothetical protein